MKDRDKTLSVAFGKMVRKYRLERNVSQEALAENAQIHRNYVGMLERGECAATLDIAEGIAQALEVQLEQLIGDARRQAQKSARR